MGGVHSAVQTLLRVVEGKEESGEEEMPLQPGCGEEDVEGCDLCGRGPSEFWDGTAAVDAADS